MRNHVVAVAWIHIVVGVFVLGCVTTIWVASARLAATFHGNWFFNLIGMFGRPIAVVLILLALVETIGAVGLLRQRSWARPMLLGVGGVEFFAFPIGTALAVYTYWVLLRK